MSSSNRRSEPLAEVNLYWLPLGAGDRTGLVRRSGRLYEAWMARRTGRTSQPLFHSALEVRVDGIPHTIEMAPAWQTTPAVERGVVGGGAVGLRWLGRSRWFRYELRSWEFGVIPDVGEAVDSPRTLSDDRERALRILDLAPCCPGATWGRDELELGEMWNSNSLVAWLLARSGHHVEEVVPPRAGRAPGWAAGLALAMRQQAQN